MVAGIISSSRLESSMSLLSRTIVLVEPLLVLLLLKVEPSLLVLLMVESGESGNIRGCSEIEAGGSAMKRSSISAKGDSSPSVSISSFGSVNTVVAGFFSVGVSCPVNAGETSL